MLACAMKTHEVVVETTCVLNLNMFGTLRAFFFGKINSNHIYFVRFLDMSPFGQQALP